MEFKGKKIEVTAEFPYPRKIVWQALTDPRALSKWFMETNFAPAVGRKFQFWAKPMRGWRGYVDCEVLEVVPEKRLAFTWQGMPEHDVTRVVYELEDVPGGTRVRASHEGFNRSHGFMAGIMFQMLLKFGWKKMFRKQIGAVLAALREGDVAKAPKFTEDGSWFENSRGKNGQGKS